MANYSQERKASVMRKLLPPENRSVRAVAEEEGISEVTLYNWRKQAREQGLAVPGSGKQSEAWSGEAKFAVVVETAGLSEAQLSAYCRSKGLYPEQGQAWRAACVTGVSHEAARRQAEQAQVRLSEKRAGQLQDLVGTA